MVHIAHPSVTVTATMGLVEQGDTTTMDSLGMDTNRQVTPNDLNSEFGGRICYDSHHRPNPHTFETTDYLKNIIEQGHHSVLEHSVVSVIISGISRTCAQELLRHRHFSPSMVSQRYVNEAKPEVSIVIPPAIEKNPQLVDKLIQLAQQTEKFYTETVEELSTEFERKQAREAARAGLLNCAETKLQLTGNMRSFREFIAKRTDPGADKEIQRLAHLVLEAIYPYSPGCLQDFAHLLEK